MLKNIAVATSFLMATLLFQNCTNSSGSSAGDSVELPFAPAGPNDPTTPTVPPPVTVQPSTPTSFTAGFTSPASRQGVSEGRMVALEARHQKLKSLGSGYRQYNIPWSAFEDVPSLKSQTAPFTCPTAHTLVPANETERVALGYRRYRCVSDAALAQFDALFALDAKYGMQTGGVLYYIPDQYRYADCQGFNFAGNFMRYGCVPRDDAMDDFEDFINLLARRYNGGANGKLSHYIVWNENGSADWFDYTPVVAHNDVSATAVNKRLDKLADMMKRAHAALLRHQKAAMLYVSTDQLWTPNQQPGHMGTQALLAGLWQRLGTTYDWSVAVHPYGAVESTSAATKYTFNNLEMVSNYQLQQLQARGVAKPTSAPQYFLIASEQGWPTNFDHGREGQARQICLAHEKVTTMPNVVAVAHNYFHSSEAQETSGGASVQGAFYGLIPYAIPDSLVGVEDTSTGQAFMATMNPATWRSSNPNFCCRAYGLGCPGVAPRLSAPSVVDTHQVIGVIDGPQNGVIRGWACTRTMEPSIAVHLYANGPAGVGTLILGAAANVASEPAISSSCGTSGAHGYRFAIPVDATVHAYAGAKIYVHGISILDGGVNNLLSNSGVYTVP